MIVDCKSADIVYTSLFTGVHGNYLKPSVSSTGLDPDNLPEGDKSAMNFDKYDKIEAKAWRDIWSAGQGVGTIDDVLPARDVVKRMEAEYNATRQRLGATA